MGVCQEIQGEAVVLDWSSHSDPNKQWLTGRTETMLQHLWKCQNVPAAVWDAAQVTCVQRCLLMNSPTAPRIVAQSELPPGNPLLPTPMFTPLPQSNQAAAGPSSSNTGVIGTMNNPAPTNFVLMPQLSVSAPANESLPLGLIMPAVCYPSDFQHSPALSSFAPSPSPSHWVENPEWLGFLQEFIPQAEPVKRQSLANHWIPMEVAKFCQEAKNHSQGLEGTLQYDGWSGINFHHFIAFMLTTSRHEDVEKNWQVDIVAVTSDASGESWKACRMLHQAFPKFVIVDCQAHQVNLVVGDFLKCSNSFTACAEQATELITWLHRKTIVLAAICDIQIALNATKPVGECVVLTLMELKATLTIMADQELSRLEAQWQIITGDARSKQKAEKMLRLIKNPTFWYQNEMFDQSLLLMGFLYVEYSKLLEADPENQLFAAMECEELIQTVLDSLEKHWKNCDQDVYIAAVVLNPIYKIAPFAKIPQLNLAGIFALICKLWTRFFGSSPPHELFTELQDYLGNKGTYTNFAPWVENVQHEAEKKEHPDPLAMYEGMQYGGGEKTPLQRVAFWLFAICANSVSCEHLFSMFGLTLTHLHSRLRSEAMTSLAELRLHLWDEHARSGQAKHRLKLCATTYSTGPKPGLQSADSTTPQAATSTTSLEPQLQPSPSSPQANTDNAVNNHTVAATATATVAEHDMTITEITSCLITSANDAGYDEESILPFEKLKLSELFEFSNPHWLAITKTVAM
ncbi:hypothetical protein BKA83DRAFT_25636 [Pisolithus microcarpus]|nr:hypothetical protein BKA83DRAFT_25636 [Pisolithus microcarpus]